MIYPMGVAGFSLLTTLSTRNGEPEKASRPFDKKRDGFVIGEGAGVLILKRWSTHESAKPRSTEKSWVMDPRQTRIALTDMDPEAGRDPGHGIAMEKACVKPENIDYINAHGTSTAVNDSLETLVIKKVMGDHRRRKFP